MKNIWKLMDALNYRRLRPFFILSAIICIVNISSFQLLIMINGNTKIEFFDDMNLYKNFATMIFISLVICLFLHLKRQRYIRENGELDRIRLLPIQKRTYYLSEAIFTFISLCIMLFGFIVAIYVIYFIYSFYQSELANEFIYILLLSPVARILLPLSFISGLQLFVLLLCFTLMITILSITHNDPTLFIKNLFLLFFIVLGLLFTFNSLYYSGYLSPSSWTMIAFVSFSDIILFYYLNRMFLTRKSRR